MTRLAEAQKSIRYRAQATIDAYATGRLQPERTSAVAAENTATATGTQREAPAETPPRQTGKTKTTVTPSASGARPPTIEAIRRMTRADMEGLTVNRNWPPAVVRAILKQAEKVRAEEPATPRPSPRRFGGRG